MAHLNHLVLIYYREDIAVSQSKEHIGRRRSMPELRSTIADVKKSTSPQNKK